MKLYQIEFKGMWPVPSGLIILADDEAQAHSIACDTITHVEGPYRVTELPMEVGVVFY
jgi:histidinol dehydrogenase